MAQAGPAVAAAAAHDVSLTGHEFPTSATVDVRCRLSDFTDECVAGGHRHGTRLVGPVVPVESVRIGAANPGAQNADEGMIDADRRLRNILQPQPGFSMRLDESAHR